jgi:ribokinase
MAVLVYGSLVPDIVFSVPRLPQAGEDVPGHSVEVVAAGGGGNVAVALAGWGFVVMAVGNTVGDDPLGRSVEAAFGHLGIETPAGLVTAGGTTPANGIIVTPDGERTIIGSDYASVAWLAVPGWDDVTAVLVDGYSGPAGTAVIEEAANRGLPAVGTDRVGPGTRHLTVLLWSGDEHPDASEAALTASEGPTVVVTNGPDPIEVYGRDGSTFQVVPDRRVAVDSTGAGDVFAAAVTAGLADGLATPLALERAADVAARFVSLERASGVPPLTTLEA